MRVIRTILRLVIADGRPSKIGLCCWHKGSNDT